MKFTTVHTCIRVHDLEKSVEFYTKALNLVETRRNDNPEAKFTLVYLATEPGAHEIELTYNYGAEPYDLGNGYSHIAFTVPNLEETYEFHKEMGVTVTELKGVGGGPKNIYFIADPDGYKVEIIRAKNSLIN